VRYKAKFKDIDQTVLFFETNDNIAMSVINLEDFSYDPDGFKANFVEADDAGNVIPDVFKQKEPTNQQRMTLPMDGVDYYSGPTPNSRLFIDVQTWSATDYIHLEDEIVRLITWYSGGNYNYWTCSRGEKDTRIAPHMWATPTDEPLTVQDARQNPLGLEADIYNEDETLVRKVFIAKLSSSGVGVVCHFSDLIEKLDRDFKIKSSDRGVTLLEHVDEDINSFGFAGILDLRRIDPIISSAILSLKFTAEDGYGWESGDAHLYRYNGTDFLNTILQATFGFISFDNGQYTVHGLTQLSIFNTPTNIALDGQIRYGGGYTTEYFRNATTVKVEYLNTAFANGQFGENEALTKTYNASTVSGVIEGSVTEIDITGIDFKNASMAEAEANVDLIGHKFIEMFSGFLGTIEVDVLTNSTLEAGVYYNAADITDFAKFVVFFSNDIVNNIVLLCLGKEDNKVKFLILDKTQFNQIGPSVLMQQVIGTKNLEQARDLNDDLFTTGNAISTATHTTDSYQYFEIADKINIYSLGFSSSIIYTIVSFPGSTTIETNAGANFTGADYVWMGYPTWAYATTKQKKLLYQDQSKII